MKHFSLALLAALVGLSAGSHVSSDVYPCPHSGVVRLAHASSCSKFVQCVNGFAVEEECAQGMFFSTEHQYCTEPVYAKCTVEQNPCPAWTDVERLVFLTNGRNCNNYFMCFDGKPLSFNCAPGFSFNANTNQCDQSQCAVSFAIQGFMHWQVRFNSLFIIFSDYPMVLWCK